MGAAYSIFLEIFPPAPHFTADSIPDLSGKVALITGANTGIGKETARVLLTKNAKVWIACRDVSKGEAAVRELKESTGQDAHLLKLDLGNLRSIKQSAEEFLQRETQLHILFNNAGVFQPPTEMVTDDGYDLQFGTNVLGAVRVVNTSSQGHLSGDLQFDTFMDGPKRRSDNTLRLYGQSKTGNIVFSAELHRRYHDQGIISTALHPGAINTEIKRHLNFFSFQYQLFNWLLFWPVSYGALTQLYAGTAPDAARLGGQYLIPWARVGTPRANTQDPQLGKELWTWLEEQVDKL